MDPPSSEDTSPDAMIGLLPHTTHSAATSEPDPLDIPDNTYQRSFDDQTFPFVTPPSSQIDQCPSPLGMSPLPTFRVLSRSHSEEQNKVLTPTPPSAMDAHLSPLSSLSSLDELLDTCQDTPSQSIQAPMVVRLAVKPPAIKKRKARARLSLPSAKRSRKKTAIGASTQITKGLDIKWPKKSDDDIAFHKKVTSRALVAYTRG